jgi:PAS domain S-box-containing protein
VPISGGTSAWSRAHPFFRYGVAVLAAVTATALKVALAAYVVPTFILAYPAVLVAAAFGGMGPGILATVISAAMAWYWVLPSPGDFHALSVQEAWALSLFLLMGVLVSVGAERMRRSQRRADALEKERELGILERRFRTYVEGSPDAILVTNGAGWVVDANPSALEMLGHDLADLETKRTADLFNGEEPGEGGPVEHDRRLRRADGTFIWVRMKSVKISDDRVVAFCRNITDRREAEQERERLVAELREALESVKTLRGLLPICMYCKKIRNDQGYWDRIESYISTRTDATFSHGICGDCSRARHPALTRSGDTPGK